jgi:hypothetical protein
VCGRLHFSLSLSLFTIDAAEFAPSVRPCPFPNHSPEKNLPLLQAEYYITIWTVFFIFSAPVVDAMSLSPAPNADQRRPLSSQTVSVSWGEDASSDGPRRFQFEVSECVETKTVTTTTTTKRTFPPIFVGESRRLESLDAKEYPLAAKPTPPELAKFSFEMPPPLEEEAWDERTPSKAVRDLSIPLLSSLLDESESGESLRSLLYADPCHFLF